MLSVNSETVHENTKNRSLGAAKHSFDKYEELMKLTKESDDLSKDDSDLTLELIKDISNEPPKLKKKSSKTKK